MMVRWFAATCLLLSAMPALARSLDRQGKAEVGRPLPRVASVGVDPNTAWSSERLLREPGTRGLAVVFFATWCKPCVAEVRALVRGRDRLERAGVRVLFVDLLEERARVARFVQEEGMQDWPVVVDSSGVIVEDFGLRDERTGGLTLPVTIVTDGHGVVRGLLRRVEDDHVGAVLSLAR